jgi:biopolymer transport protein ExbD
MEFRRRKRRHSHIDVAPLVDVVFNLLLFFVITYNVVVDPAARIRLPESSTADSQAAEQQIITLTREGEAYVGERVVDIADLSGVVQQKLGELQEQSVRIRADREAPVGMLIKVVDGVRLAGCQAFTIVTERK